MRAARPVMAGLAQGLRTRRIALALPGNLPHAVVIGAQKAGTSSLFQALASHPDLAPARIKETHFLDRHWTRGVGWYRRCFPRSGAGLEATPAYLFHPFAAARLAQIAPQARVIAILRDPLARAVSHHAYETRRGTETRPMAEAFDAEARETDEDYRRALRDPAHWPRSLQRHSYLRRGLYAAQLARWQDYFGDRLLVLEDRDLYEDPAASLRRVQDHLWLQRVALTLPHRNAGRLSPPRPLEGLEGLERYRARFAADGRALAAMYGQRFSWLS